MTADDRSGIGTLVRGALIKGDFGGNGPFQKGDNCAGQSADLQSGLRRNAQKIACNQAQDSTDADADYKRLQVIDELFKEASLEYCQCLL